jgi:GT2 family glycosyltransferase
MPSTIIDNDERPLSESKLLTNESTLDDFLIRQMELELDLLKKDYKELLGKWHLKKELASAQAQVIETIKASIPPLLQAMSELAGRNNELISIQDRAKQDISDGENIRAEQNRKIHTLYEQTDMLNTRISEIYASEGWKLLSVYYRIRNAALPRGSARHEKVKKAVNWLRRKKQDEFIMQDHSKPKAIPSENAAPTRFEPFEFPYFANPLVSIIIPAHNGWEINYRCLRSIRENTEAISYEVIFADDASTDDTQYVNRFVKNLVHIRNGKNLGFLQNCNHAALFARGEYLHFLNNDTEVTEGWLYPLIGLMEKDPSIGMAGSKLVYPDGRLQEAGGIIWQDASGWNYGHKQDPDAPEFNYVKEVDYLSGASILVRKTLWEKLGGFDERFSPAYCEDSDLAFSVRKEGYKVVYQPLSKVIHHEGFSHGKDSDTQNGATGVKSYQRINSMKFAEKWQADLQGQFPNAVNPYWTRDRSRNKPTIVVIDHYVPHFDKDGGSRTTFQYLELFTELGMNVKFIGDNFYRHEPYTTILQQKGIEVLYGSYYAENWLNWLTDNERYIDYIFLNRPHISIKYINHIKNNMHGKIFYYTHDLHFYRELMEYEITGQADKLKSSASWKQMEYTLFANSDTVLTPSMKEKAIIQQDFPDKAIEVMPAFFYPSISDPIRDFAERKDILFVGGFTHGPNIDGVLWFAKEIMPLINEKNPTIRLIVVGSNTPPEIATLDSPDIVIKGFVTDEELDRLYRSVRFSVIPLRFGAGLKGKTVESLSKALPIVSTLFGIEGLPDFGHIAIPRDTAGAFADEVVALYDDIDRLESLSTAASVYAQKHFTKDSATAFFKILFKV